MVHTRQVFSLCAFRPCRSNPCFMSSVQTFSNTPLSTIVDAFCGRSSFYHWVESRSLVPTSSLSSRPHHVCRRLRCNGESTVLKGRTDRFSCGKSSPAAIISEFRSLCSTIFSAVPITTGASGASSRSFGGTGERTFENNKIRFLHWGMTIVVPNHALFNSRSLCEKEGFVSPVGRVRILRLLCGCHSCVFQSRCHSWVRIDARVNVKKAFRFVFCPTKRIFTGVCGDHLVVSSACSTSYIEVEL